MQIAVSPILLLLLPTVVIGHECYYGVRPAEQTVTQSKKCAADEMSCLKQENAGWATYTCGAGKCTPSVDCNEIDGHIACCCEGDLCNGVAPTPLMAKTMSVTIAVAVYYLVYRLLA